MRPDLRQFTYTSVIHADNNSAAWKYTAMVGFALSGAQREADFEEREGALKNTLRSVLRSCDAATQSWALSSSTGAPTKSNDNLAMWLFISG